MKLVPNNVNGFIKSFRNICQHSEFQGSRNVRVYWNYEPSVLFNYHNTDSVSFFDKNLILLRLQNALDARHGTDINHFNWVSTRPVLKYEGCAQNTWDLIPSHTPPITPKLIVPSFMPYHTVFSSLSTAGWHMKFSAMYEPQSINKTAVPNWSVCILCYGYYQVWSSW